MKNQVSNNLIDLEIKNNILSILENRFNSNMNRHPNTKWEDVRVKLENNDKALWTLNEMEVTGGEVDVVDIGYNTITFIDCAKESPIGRRSLCYDNDALNKRKEHKPINSAVNMAIEMGIDLLTEEEYRKLQKIEKLDQKTSSWIKTPNNIRSLGGALFCDRRYETVFVYHNGAESYYSSRGFRGILKL